MDGTGKNAAAFALMLVPAPSIYTQIEKPEGMRFSGLDNGKTAGLCPKTVV